MLNALQFITLACIR